MILTKKEKTMKKLFSTLTLTVCLGAFISCTNDEQEVNMVKPTNANSEIEVINDGTMIKFKDVQCLLQNKLVLLIHYLLSLR